MKLLITYHSDTGNTKKLAEAIYESIDDSKTMLPFDKVDDTSRYDVIFIGFPIHQFGPCQSAKDFINEKVNEKKVTLFATHAMPLKAPRYKSIEESCRSAVKDNDLVGLYTCQGELSEEIAQFLSNSEDKKLKAFGKKRKETIGHPNNEEITAAAEFAKNILNQIR